MITFPQKYILLCTALTLLFFTGCTRNDAQREFEKEAYAAPRNFTHTTFEGRVTEVDEDDWRTAPLFQGLVEIAPPFPNPVSTDQMLQIDISVTGVRSVSGLEILVRFEDGTLQYLYQYFDNLQPGLTSIQLNPIEFSEFGTPEGARGLSRIFIYNGSRQMISYGDVMVE